ncbi:substrate-binding domain-containing protein [Arthrobacter sp. Br18]|uniref:substrate-binding domain-containing protein n=1 Tax=Arthrobacter sp. Br18 TaxID=1312954 RepID=UPI0031B836AC
MALGVMAALRSVGVSVPGDMMVTGFDDIPTLRDSFPLLTTMRLPLEEMGETAAHLALTRTASTPAPIRGEVLIRDTTCPFGVVP